MKKSLFVLLILVPMTALWNVGYAQTMGELFNNINKLIKNAAGEKVNEGVFSGKPINVKSQIFENDKFIYVEKEKGEKYGFVIKHSDINWYKLDKYGIRFCSNEKLKQIVLVFDDILIKEMYHEDETKSSDPSYVREFRFYCLEKDQEKVEYQLNLLNKLVQQYKKNNSTNEQSKGEGKNMKTASGLEYTITQEGKKGGKQPKPGDMVTVHYTGKFTNDTVFDSSVKRGEPIKFTLGVGQVIKGWDEGIALLHEGDKAVFTIPPDLGYGSQARGPIPANSTLIFEVELIAVKEKIVPKPFDVAGKDTVTTASGLKVIKIAETKGEQPKPGQTVNVHYTGYLLDGKKFDSSVERDQPFQFALGQGQVIRGWDEGIALLKKGEKARLIIPYTLGYGENGYPPIIPAKADLVFDVELIDFK
jgi:peptidylprolyl isomerase